MRKPPSPFHEPQPMDMPFSVLIVAASADDALPLTRQFQKIGFAPDCAEVYAPEALSEALESRIWDAIVIRLSAQAICGRTELELVRRGGQDAPVIIVAQPNDMDDAASMLVSGASNVLFENELSRVALIVEREARRIREARCAAVQAGMEAWVQSSRDGVLFVSIAREAIVFANAAARQLLGCPDEQIRGRQLRVFFPGQTARQLAAREAPEGSPGRRSLIGRCDDGREVPFACSVSRFTTNGAEFLSLTVRPSPCAADECSARQSESRYRVIFESTQDAVFVMQQYHVIDCNTAALRMFGCRREQIVGERPESFSPALQPDGQDSSVKAGRYVAAALSGAPQRFEWRHLRFDGTEFDAEVSLDYFWEDGRALLLSVVRDVTERKQAEEALRNREEQLLLLVKHAPAAIAMLDAEMRYLAVSDRFLTDYRLGSRDLVGLHHYDVFPEILNMKEWRDVHRRCLAGATERGEDPFLRSDGALDWVKWEIVPWRKPSGPIGGIVVFSEVVTEQKNAQEALRQSNEELDRFFSVTLDMLCIAGLDGRFRRLNAAWERTLGYSCEELTSTHFMEFVHPDDIPRTLEAMDSLVSRRELINFTNRFRHKDGVYRWLEWRSAVSGGLIYAAARDITERVDAERQLRQFNLTLERRIADRTAQLRILAERLSRTEHRERKRIAHILHEHFQQLLVAATMQLEMLKRSSKDSQSIGVIDNASRILAQAIEASRSLAIELSPPILECLGLIPTLEWLARRTREIHGLPVVLYADHRAEPVSDDVKAFLFEIASELLLNVVKHANAESASVRIGFARGDELSLSVSDNGTGFDIQQLEQPTNEGLGLFSIKERLEWLGGVLQIESAPGKGTRVTVRVPSDPTKNIRRAA